MSPPRSLTPRHIGLYVSNKVLYRTFYKILNIFYYYRIHGKKTEPHPCFCGMYLLYIVVFVQEGAYILSRHTSLALCVSADLFDSSSLFLSEF